MKNGHLSQYFESVAVKKLSAVEVNLAKSHQHEFNGSKELKMVLRTQERTQFPTKFLWIEEQNEALSDEGTVTWYDARERHPTRSEFRLYFPSNLVMGMAKEGDIMFIAKRTDGSLLMILTATGSTIESQLYWMFGLPRPLFDKFEISEIEKDKDHEVDFATRFIFDELELEIEEPENDLLDKLLARFYGKFPSTLEFSKFARESLTLDYNAIDDPDGAIMSLMEWEEKLFRRMERHIVANRLKDGFVNDDGQDVDGFINFSLSVQNRRKSRAGYAFEDHIAFIFQQNKIKFSSRLPTENKARPDFIFPDIKLYHKPSFPTIFLTMLGAKTSCKDRWRQILSEAARIEEKHLITLEPGISENQTKEMEVNKLRLVLPKSLYSSYSVSQQSWLINLKDFITLVADKQNKSKEFFI